MWALKADFPRRIARSTLSFTAVVATLVCLGVAGVEGQGPVELSDPAVCDECRIVMDSVLILDGRTSQHVGRPLAIVRLSDGRVLLVSDHDAGRIVVFDGTGRHVATIGRSGEGPGEYRFIGSLKADAGDTVRVTDVRLARVTVLSPDLAFVRSYRLEAPSMVIAHLSEDRTIIAQHIPTRQRAGFPLHFLGPDGRIQKSFGVASPTYDRRQHDLLRRVISRASDHGIWAAPLTSYTLELWSLDARLVESFVRVVPWFPPHDRVGLSVTDPDAAPNPLVMDIRLDDRDLLWVTLFVPAESWRDGLGEVSGIHGRRARAVIDPDRYGDSIVEVIDWRRREVLASARFDRSHGWALGGGYVGFYREDEVGYPAILIYRIRLIHNGG